MFKQLTILLGCCGLYLLLFYGQNLPRYIYETTDIRILRIRYDTGRHTKRIRGLLASLTVINPDIIGNKAQRYGNGANDTSSETSATRNRSRKSGSLHLQKRLPQAIIIGVKKAGTRALLEYLKLHPDVRAPGPEIHFFDRYFYRGLDWYRAQMPETLPTQVTLEKTPSYLITRGVPMKIRSMNPNTKLIIVVRNPVTRAISDYSQKISKARSSSIPSFEAFAFRYDQPKLPLTNNHNSTINGSERMFTPVIHHSNSNTIPGSTLTIPITAHRSVNVTWRAIKLGLYHRHTLRWLKHFPLKSMHFVSGERLITNPSEEVNLVERFLGIRTIITGNHFYFNSSKGFPCLKKSSDNDTPHCLGRTKGRTHPYIEDWALRSLAQFYAPHNDIFYKLVGRKFNW